MCCILLTNWFSLRQNKKSCKMVIDDQDKWKNLLQTASISPFLQGLFDFAWRNPGTASKQASSP